MLTQIEGVLFDKDGTLFDFNATWSAWASAFLDEISGGDKRAAEQMGQAIGFDTATHEFQPNSPVVAGTPHEIAQLLLPFLPGSTPAGLVTRMNAAAAAAPMSEAAPLAPLLQALSQRGLRLGVATNDAEAPAKAHLQTAGVLEWFDMVIGCDSGYGAKPSPGQLLAFADLSGVAPARTVMVGDSRHDLIAGRAAGMMTIGVLTGMSQQSDLEELADVVLPNIGHVPAYLGKIAA